MSLLIADGRSVDDLDAMQADLIARGVEYCVGSYVDVHGVTKAKMVPADCFARMCRGSELYTVGALDGMGDLGPEEDECAAVADIRSAVVCPWDRHYAWAACDLSWHGEPYPLCSRSILRRTLRDVEARGWTFNLGVEPEFYVLREIDGRYAPLSPTDTLKMPGYDLRSTFDSMPFLSTMVAHLKELEWGVYSFDHEGGRGQFEFDFGYADALTMADRFTFFRLMARQVAQQMGMVASFMPKPFAEDFGSGAHFNMSIADADGKNLFIDPKGPHGLNFSKLGLSFTAGVLKHAKALTALTCPLPNSYKRLITRGLMPDITWAPVFIAYGSNNRSAMLRLPGNRPCLENRAPDVSCNIYLAAAFSIAAGLEGIEEALDPRAPTNDNLYLASDELLAERKIDVLPRTLLEALDHLESDPLTEKVLGPELKKAYLKEKSMEWAEFHNQVTDPERQRWIRFF
ncbi:MAG: type III glutamate--ammonia ligase [Chloroflexi bacterium]|nr:MAG: type III glutamate--ammonia ligase [Chloroflexota bacterium]TMG17257.1 MAG: type III glutamate--ammonia ligase [Chloroflexota bacterium]TMG21859.1 MAG: type III glutamate--ammonia ligase [Chloroflexota bacterium]TMG64620.1 MAG: type III glutamate--ammonia ligase [Chloroflexota bacterium]